MSNVATYTERKLHQKSLLFEEQSPRSEQHICLGFLRIPARTCSALSEVVAKTFCPHSELGMGSAIARRVALSAFILPTTMLERNGHLGHHYCFHRFSKPTHPATDRTHGVVSSPGLALHFQNFRIIGLSTAQSMSIVTSLLHTCPRLDDNCVSTAEKVCWNINALLLDLSLLLSYSKDVRRREATARWNLY
jgi:hypothetical protein